MLLPLMISSYYLTIMTHPGSPSLSIAEMEDGMNHEFISFEMKRNGRVLLKELIVAEILYKV